MPQGAEDMVERPDERPGKGGRQDILQASISRVRRRELTSRLLGIAALDILVVISVYAAYLLLQRLLGLPGDPWLALGAALGAAALATAIHALLRLRLSPFGAAVLADERMRLKERISSAIYLERRPPGPGGDPSGPAWAELVRSDGRKALAGVDIARHFPIRIPRLLRWTVLPTLLAIAISFLPPLDLLGIQGHRQADAALRREVEKKRDELARALEKMREEAEKPPDPQIQKLLDALARQIREEKPLEKKDVTDPAGDQAKKDAMVEFARLEEALRKELEKTQFGALKEFLDRLPPGSKVGSPLTGALREALKAGEFGKALSELKQLQDQLAALKEKEKAGGLSPEELAKMQKLAEELQRLAKDSAALSRLAQSLSGASGALQSGDLGLSMEELAQLMKEMGSLEDALRDMKALEQALELAQLSLEDLAKLHKCPDCGKVSQDPGGT